MRECVLTPVRWLLLAVWLAPLSAAQADESSAPLDADARAILEEFGRELAGHIQAGDIRHFDEVFDEERFAWRVVADVEVPTEVRENFAKGMVKGMGRTPGSPLSSFFGQSYEFLRVHSWQGSPTLLFRLRPPDGGFNYHVFLFELESPREVSIYDVYVMSTGEDLSDSLRRLALPGLVQQDRSLLDRLLGRDRGFVEHMETFREMGLEIQAGNHQEALRLHAQLPLDMRQDKTLRLMEINTLAELEGVDGRYLTAIEDYRDDFPKDPALPMILLDYHMVKGDYEVAMGIVDEIGGWVGGDEYLEVLRISTAILGGRPSEALERAIDYLARFPDDEEARWLQVSAALSTRSHGVVREALEYLEEHHDYLFTEESLAGSSQYAEFLKSLPAREFLAARASEPEATTEE